MTTSSQAASVGTFRIGGAIEVSRLGFGAMRLTGRGVWGPPADKAECIRTLKRLSDEDFAALEREARR